VYNLLKGSDIQIWKKGVLTMKKATILVLAVALIMAMAVPALAVDSPTAPAATPDKTAGLPEVVESVNDCRFLSIYEADELPEEDRERFIAAQECLEEAVPEGMTVKYFFYHIHVDGTAQDGLCEDTFDIGEFEKVVVKQYVDDEWIELEELGKKTGEPRKVTVNPNGTITVTGFVTGPVAFFIQ